MSVQRTTSPTTNSWSAHHKVSRLHTSIKSVNLFDMNINIFNPFNDAGGCCGHSKHIVLSIHFSVHCEVGEWSEWSPCFWAGRTCGFKHGQETRTRQVLQYPSPFGNPCPEISEIKECQVKRKKCPGKEMLGLTQLSKLQTQRMR